MNPDFQFLSTRHSKSQPIVTKRSKLHILIDCLVNILGNLNLGHCWLSNCDSRSTIGVGQTKTSIAIGTKTKTIAIAEWETSSIGQGGSSFYFSNLFSRPLASGFSFSQAGNGESKEILAASLLDSIGDGLHRDLNFLNNWLDDMRGVGEGCSYSIRVANTSISITSKEQMRISRSSSKDRAHQQGLHYYVCEGRALCEKSPC